MDKVKLPSFLNIKNYGKDVQLTFYRFFTVHIGSAEQRPEGIQKKHYIAYKLSKYLVIMVRDN